MEDAAVPLWAILTIAGPVALGAAMAYGVIRNRWRRRTREAPRRGQG
jgi:hypothetical protein